MSNWAIPNKWQELFSEPEKRYHIHDYDCVGDNIYAMDLFLDAIEITDVAIALHDGTQVYLQHPDYEYQICIDSSGDGDFHLHGYDVTRVFGEDRVKKEQPQ